MNRERNIMINVRIGYNAIGDYSIEKFKRLLKYLKDTGVIIKETDDGCYVMADTAAALLKDLYPLIELNKIPINKGGYAVAYANNLLEQLDSYSVVLIGKPTGVKRF
jgi:hypothetical protein